MSKTGFRANSIRETGSVKISNPKILNFYPIHPYEKTVVRQHWIPWPVVFQHWVCKFCTTQKRMSRTGFRGNSNPETGSVEISNPKIFEFFSYTPLWENSSSATLDCLASCSPTLGLQILCYLETYVENRFKRKFDSRDRFSRNFEPKDF